MKCRNLYKYVRSGGSLFGAFSALWSGGMLEICLQQNSNLSFSISHLLREHCDCPSLKAVKQEQVA